MRVMVSAWPSIGNTSRSTSTEGVVAQKHVALNPDGVYGVVWPDSVCNLECYLYDPIPAFCARVRVVDARLRVHQDRCAELLVRCVRA